jgi:hypothetical protein
LHQKLKAIDLDYTVLNISELSQILGIHRSGLNYYPGSRIKYTIIKHHKHCFLTNRIMHEKTPNNYSIILALIMGSIEGCLPFKRLSFYK